jgi:hypothetical protein
MAKAKKLRMRRVVLYAARSVLGKGGQTNTVRYLLQYNCLPPPMFMFIITLMQIVSYFYYALATEEKLMPLGPVPYDSIFILNPHHLQSQQWRFLTYQ